MLYAPGWSMLHSDSLPQSYRAFLVAVRRDFRLGSISPQPISALCGGWAQSHWA